MSKMEQIVIKGESSSIPRIFDLVGREIVLSNIGEDKKEEIVEIVKNLIQKLGKKYDITEENAVIYRYYGKKTGGGGPNGIEIRFNSFSSDIKGTLLIGFTGNDMECYYIFYTHIDYLDPYISKEYKEFTKNLITDAKDNKLKMIISKRYGNGLCKGNESPYANPIFYRKDSRIHIEGICNFIDSINNIGQKYPLYGESVWQI
jgi:hypothetical protein